MEKHRGQKKKKSLQRFCYYYYCITGHLKIKSNFKTPVLRVALSDPHINSHKGATLPAAGWHGATALPAFPTAPGQGKAPCPGISLPAAELPFQAQQHCYSLKTQSGHNPVQYLGIMRCLPVVSVYSVPELNLVKASRKVHSVAINEFVSHALKYLQIKPITNKAR